jgi:hypothetical protein
MNERELAGVYLFRAGVLRSEAMMYQKIAERLEHSYWSRHQKWYRRFWRWLTEEV